MSLKIQKSIVIFIVGPTAVGKTHLAVKLAKRIHGEIISCDSMQVYKGMRNLSQIPSISVRAKVKHHLVGVLDPRKEYNVAIFIEKAIELIKSMKGERKVPIVVGGSGLYAKALIDGIFPSPKADLRFRKDMHAFVVRYGSKRLHKRLSKIDPDTARNIHPNDARRIIRALEIFHSTGRTIADIKGETIGLYGKYDIKIFGLTRPREEIYSSINARVDKMFEDGVLNEVRRLRKSMALSKTAKAVLGFKEISEFLKGEYDLEKAKELLKRNTRHFAKRQLTWFKADRRIRWFDVSKIGDEEIVRTMVRVTKSPCHKATR